MITALGFVIVLACVFGSYMLSGGNMVIVMEAMPHEFMTIAGAAVGAMIVANKTAVLKKMGKTVMMAIDGSKKHKHEYQDLLCLMFLLCKLIKSKGLIALEKHIETPAESGIFNQFPTVLKDPFAVDLICDTLRTVTMGVENPHQVEEMISKKLEKLHHERGSPAHSLQTIADGLPALGIVAAVLGVIKTMASINKPPEILGQMIGGALVGTFLGVFLSYCFVGPISNKAQQVVDEEQQFYFIIRDVLVAHLSGSAPQVSMEIGRGNVPSYYQPTFLELEQASGDLKVEG